jgi:dienelactone hydrolase
MGIDEPRLTGLALDLAGSGIGVMTMALPDLQRYEITPRSTDVIEDAVTWASQRSDLAADGRVGIVGISFAGGMAIVAAGRPSIRDRVAFVLSFGGHGDLPRVVRYLCTGEAPHAGNVEIHPPHDYGVAVVLYGMASVVVPPEQVEPLRDGIRTFLLASQLTLVDQKKADATFAAAREAVKTLPAPASTYLRYVNDRNVKALGPVLVPHIKATAADPAISPQRAAVPPAAPVYLLHGAGDTVIPPVESVLLGDHLRSRDADVRVLLSRLITHAEVDQSAAATETLKLVTFWASLLQQ